MSSFPQRATPISIEQMEDEIDLFCRAAGIWEWSWSIHAPLTKEHERNPRRYAQMYEENGKPVFEFADQTRWLPAEYRAGLYIHEIGHYLDQDPKKTEDGADACGMIAFDCLILYDHRWPGKGLQTAVW